MSNRYSRYLLLLTLALLLPVQPFASPSASFNPAFLAGRWDVVQTALSIHGKPGLQFGFKTAEFMVYDFSPDGTWALEGAGQNRSQGSWTYKTEGSKLVLHHEDPTSDEEWQVKFGDNGNAMTVKTTKIFYWLKRLQPSPDGVNHGLK